MKDQFKNFGEALAWMMESPENVAVGDATRTKWYQEKMWYDPGDGTWIVSAGNVPGLSLMSWSRAKKEPKVFRFEGTIRTVPLIGTAYIDAGDVVLAEILKPFSEGTKVEVVLTVHEEAN